MKNKSFSIILFVFFSLLNLHSNDLLNIPHEFLKIVENSSNNEINENNIINHLFYLESKIVDMNTIQKAYNILGEILKKAKKEIKNNYSPEEKLNKIYDILKNDFNFNYNESSSELFSKCILSKNTKCDTGSFLFITIADEMNLPVSCILLPNHMYISWNDVNGKFNFETTNSGIFEDDFYTKKYNITAANMIRCSGEELMGFFYHKIGSIKFESKEYDIALNYFNNAIRLNQKSPIFYYNRGMVKNKLKNYYNAIDDFNKAVELNDTDYNIYFGRGNAKYETKDLFGAIDDYNNVIELNDKFYEAYYNRGMVKSELEDYYGSIEDYKKIIGINNKDYKIFFILGNLYYKIKEYFKAIDYYTMSLNLNNKFPDGFYSRGLAKKELQNYYDAIEDLNISIGLNNKFANAYYERGFIHYNLNKIDEAIIDFKNAISIEPDLILNMPEEIQNKLKE